MFQLNSMIIISFIIKASVLQVVLASNQECTRCDMHATPAENGDATALLICQPGYLGQQACHGDYSLRSTAVPDICQKINEYQCFTLDDLKCSNGNLCLKWGSDAYAGVALIPPGVIVQGYGSWTCNWDQPRGSKAGGEHGSRWNFWDYDWRIDAFQLKLMDGYECVNSVVQKKASEDVVFQNYVGKWEYIGSGVTVAQSATRSWQETTSNSYSNAWTAGLKVAGEASFFETYKVSAEVSTSYTTSSQKTLSSMKAGSSSYTCNSVDCSDGHLFQWKISADMIVDSSSTSQFIQECSFVCVPSKLPAHSTPKCPPRYCGDLAAGCQCCNSNFKANGDTKCCKMPCVDSLPR